MNNTQQLFNELMVLCSKNEAFYFKDFKNLDSTYRIFDYRLASYTDFCEPSALSCRGIMFEIDDKGNCIRIASRPMDKFFNYGENPFTIFDKSLSSTELEMGIDKLDGSLISSFMNSEIKVQMKSKGSLFSEHAILATQLIRSDLKKENEVTILESLGYTVNFELLSPQYRIVVSYPENEIRFLNARHRETGEYLKLEEVQKNYPALFSTSVYKDGYFSNSLVLKETVLDTVQGVYDMLDNIEGFVFKLKNGTFFKVKTNKYCSLHHTKDSILIESRLFNVVLDGGSDDLRQIFKDDAQSIESIKKMEQKVFMAYNSIISDVTDFYEKHKDLERKEYAQKVTSLLPQKYNLRGLAFTLYQNKVPDYKENLRKHMKEVLQEV